MRRAAALLCAAGLLAAGAAAAGGSLRPKESPLEREALSRLINAIEQADCAQAVKELNAGLKARYPGVYVMAGSMYEGGVCLKPSWERAERMYLQAAEAGHEGGRLRLVAGLAENRRDIGAALWWLQQSRASVPDQCRITGFVAEDPDAFVLTLQRWAPERIDLCVYAAGVMAQLSSDIDYPNVALSFGESALVRAEFIPAEGRIEVRTLSRETMSGQYGLAWGMDGSAASRKAGSALEVHVREMAKRALARFPRPAGLPPEVKVGIEFDFRVYME